MDAKIRFPPSFVVKVFPQRAFGGLHMLHPEYFYKDSRHAEF